MLNCSARTEFGTVRFEGLKTYFANLYYKQEQSRYWQMLRARKHRGMTMTFGRNEIGWLEEHSFFWF